MDLERAEEFWIGAVRQYFDRMPLVLSSDTSRTVADTLRELFAKARERKKAGAGTRCLGLVVQTLVAAKMRVVQPGLEVHAAPVADAPTDCGGDFELDGYVIHCTTMPMTPLMEKRAANVEAGANPVILTIRERVQAARSMLEDIGVAGRDEVWEVEQLLSANVFEHSLGGSRNATMGAIVDEYNRIMLDVEREPGLRIRFDWQKRGL